MHIFYPCEFFFQHIWFKIFGLNFSFSIFGLKCGMCRCIGSTFVFCTVDQRNLVYMHTSPNVYASWVVPPSGATRATVSTGQLNYFSNPVALQGMPF